MYLIVVGAGNIGSPLIEAATNGGNEVVVIERDREVAEAAATQYDCLVINDDATTAETLEEAGIDRADGIISTTDTDATNIMVMLLATDYGVSSRVSVVHNEDHQALFRRVGVNIMENPQQIIAEHLLRAVQRPSIKDVLHLAGDAEVFEITVTDNAPIAGMSLHEADNSGVLGDDSLLVVAIERDDDVITPKGDTKIRAGDLVAVFSKHGFKPDVLNRFAPEGEPA